MNENNIVTYSFMSALLSGGGDIYTFVYLPLAKRAVNAEATGGKKSINVDDLIYSMNQLYGLNIPSVIAQKLLKMIYKESSRKQKSDFSLAFDEKESVLSFERYAYNEKEKIYEKERRNTNKLQDEFQRFMSSENPDITDYPSFSEFIDKNKQSLSAFFSGKKTSEIEHLEKSYLPHAQYLQAIERCDHTLYETAKSVYLGTLMATFLEDAIDLNVKVLNRTRYFLDTQLILEAFDLQEDGRMKPVQELLKLIRQSGGIVSILDVTLDEIRNILKTSIERFETNGIDLVVDACKRRGKTISWLTSFTSKIEERLKNDLQIDIVPCSKAEVHEFLNTDEYKKLSHRWMKGNRAKHDAIAFLYVRKRRSIGVSSIQKVGYWFVTANEDLYSFNSEERPDFGFPEIATPAFLTGILFLSNPSKSVNSVSHLMLSEAIAQVMAVETPSIDIINEFEQAVSELGIVSPDEYMLLRDALCQKSSKVLRAFLNDKAALPNVTRNLVNQAQERQTEVSEYQKHLHKSMLQNKILYSILIVFLAVIAYLIVKQYSNLSVLMIVVFVTLCVLAIIAVWIWHLLGRFWKKLLAFILSLGPLWTFCNFVLNIIKSTKFSYYINKIWSIVQSYFLSNN